MNLNYTVVSYECLTYKESNWYRANHYPCSITTKIYLPCQYHSPIYQPNDNLTINHDFNLIPTSFPNHTSIKNNDTNSINLVDRTRYPNDDRLIPLPNNEIKHPQFAVPVNTENNTSAEKNK